MSEQKLLPCPFCGARDVALVPYENNTECEIVCSSCRGRGPRFSWIEGAVDSWNRRAPVLAANHMADEWYCPSCEPTDGAGCGACPDYPKRRQPDGGSVAQQAKDSPDVFDSEIDRLNEKLYGSGRAEMRGKPHAEAYCLGAYDALAAARARFNAAQPVAQTGVPDGYVLVPIEATEAMIGAGLAAIDGNGAIDTARSDAQVCYLAMLAASQESPK